MKEKKKDEVKALIFDMDNTLLQSNINFSEMKKDLFTYLNEEGLLASYLELSEHTCATLIELAKTKGMTSSQEEVVWAICERHEVVGMQDAGLEEGAHELLQALATRFTLTILTNNAQEAAEKALKTTGISKYFDMVVGREKVKELKPSSKGVQYILGCYPQIPPEKWIFIGDAWIDGKAAQGAEVLFISYKGNVQELNERKIPFISNIENLLDIKGILHIT